LASQLHARTDAQNDKFKRALHTNRDMYDIQHLGITLHITYEGWNFNSGNYLFTTDTK